LLGSVDGWRCPVITIAHLILGLIGAVILYLLILSGSTERDRQLLITLRITVAFMLLLSAGIEMGIR